MSALPDVLESARFVMRHSRQVALNDEAISGWSKTHKGETFATPPPPAELQFSGSREETANLVLLLDCLNFCFWSERPWSVEFRGRTWTRTYAMYASVLRAVESDPAWLGSERWAAADAADVASLFRGHGEIPLLRLRREVLNETGRHLNESFDGQFVNAVEQADRHAQRLAHLLAVMFPSFRDAVTYRGRTVALLKRAQICAADLQQWWTQQGYEGLNGLDDLTVFADYRLPQYLRHIGAIRLAPELAATIDAECEIDPGSDEEVEIRAATVVAGDLLQQALRNHGASVAAWQLDYFLWERSHDAEVTVPHHRSRTIFY